MSKVRGGIWNDKLSACHSTSPPFLCSSVGVVCAEIGFLRALYTKTSSCLTFDNFY